VPPPALVLSGILSVQLGAGLAARLFGSVTPAAVTGLRLWSAAVLLAALGARGLAGTVRTMASQRAWRDAGVAIAFGLTLGIMNFSIYQSFARIPLGIAVTIEFLGPLAVAVASSRRLIDLLWVALAGAGVLLLARGGTTAVALGGHHPGPGAVAAGVAFALVAAAGWAAYILLSAATGRRFSGSSGLVIAMLVAAVVVTPPAVASARGALGRPGVLAAGVGIGLLSSVIPYRFEMEALRRVPAGVFGIWMSLEPAVAALIGLVVLSQTLAGREWAAIGCVMIACAGSARGIPGPHPDRARPPPPDRATGSPPGGPGEPGPGRPDPSRPSPSEPDPSRPDPSSPGPGAPGPARPDPSSPGPGAPGPARPDPSRPDAGEPGQPADRRNWRAEPQDAMPPPPG
jgi:inner membrane transporter RhtA